MSPRVPNPFGSTVPSVATSVTPSSSTRNSPCAPVAYAVNHDFAVRPGPADIQLGEAVLPDTRHFDEGPAVVVGSSRLYLGLERVRIEPERRGQPGCAQQNDPK